MHNFTTNQTLQRVRQRCVESVLTFLLSRVHGCRRVPSRTGEHPCCQPWSGEAIKAHRVAQTVTVPLWQRDLNSMPRHEGDATNLASNPALAGLLILPGYLRDRDLARGRFDGVRMKRTLAAGLALISALPLAAQSGGVFELTWSSIDGGGGVATGGSFRVLASVAQPDATPAAPLLGGTFRLLPGFLVLGENAPAADSIFADGFE